MTQHHIRNISWANTPPTHVQLTCTCGWTSPPTRPETGHAIFDLKAAHQAHILVLNQPAEEQKDVTSMGPTRLQHAHARQNP